MTFGNIAAEKICNLMAYSVPMCMWISQNRKPLYLALVPASCSILKVSAVPTFIQKFLYYVFCSITSKSVQIFDQNSFFVVETQVYTKPLTSNCRLLPSNARSLLK